MVSLSVPGQQGIRKMTALRFARTSVASWKITVGDVSAYVIVDAANNQVAAFLEKAAALPCLPQYSIGYSVGYIQFIDSAVVQCANQLLSLLDEHHKSGSVEFYPVKPERAAYQRLTTLQ